MAKQPSKDPVKEIIDGIEKGIMELFESERYRRYLATMSRFHNYSVNNTMLIYLQKPDATLVAGFNRWKKQFGRHVKGGETGIRIIAPAPYMKKVEELKLDPDTQAPILDAAGEPVKEERTVKVPRFKVVSVFDVAQTEGKPLPQLALDLHGNVQHFEIFLEALKRTSPVPLEIKPIPDDTDGFFSLTNQDITIRAGMSQVQTVSACVHEIAHAKLHNTPQEPDPEQPPKDRRTEEVEAESISYAVCQYFGIETSDNSFGYIAEWSKGRELKELRSSLEVINETASSLISDIEKHFHQLCQEKGIDLTPATEQSIDSQNKPSQRETNILAFDIDQLLLDYYTFAHLRDYPDREEARKEIVQGLLDGSAKYSLEEIQSIADDTDSQYSSQAKALHQRLTDYLNRMHPGWEEKETTAEPVAAMLPDSPEQTKEEPLPDSTITHAFMESYGYKDSGMLPLSHDRAKELMAHDVTLYMLYEDGTESMVLDEWDIAHHDGLFGISREDWEAIKAQVPARDVEKRFLDFPGDAFAIYQLRPDAPAELFGAQFSNLSKPPEEANYQAVYVRYLNPGDDVQTNLYNIVDIFTRDMPRDFTGHENDIGDIIALKRSGEVSYHYCDYIGFREIPSFQRAENHLKAAEMSMEDDYGMIDGIINNGKAPSVAEQERKDKKPSLLAQLHQPVQERTTRTAPKKSAERDI